MRNSIKSRHVSKLAAIYGSDHGEVVSYRAHERALTFDVRLERETLRLNLNPVASLFAQDKFIMSCCLHYVFKKCSWSGIQLLHFLQQLNPANGTQVMGKRG